MFGKVYARNSLSFTVEKGPSIDFWGPGKQPFPRGFPAGYPARKVYVNVFLFSSMTRQGEKHDEPADQSFPREPCASKSQTS